MLSCEFCEIFKDIYFANVCESLPLKNNILSRVSLRKSLDFYYKSNSELFYYFFFSIWVFFHEHSLFTGQQGKAEGIFLIPLYHFHPLHGHLNISRAIIAVSSLLHIASSRTRTGNLWFLSTSR